MSSNGKFKCRKVPLVFRFCTPDKIREYELSAHHFLILYHPLRKESDLKSGTPPKLYK